MKRIMFISYHTCPLSCHKEIGGMNTYIFELSRALAKRGYPVDIYTRFKGKKGEKIVKTVPNLRVIHLRGEDTARFAGNLKVFIEKEKLNYTLISAHYYLSGRIGMILKKHLGIPLIMTFHTLALMKNLVARHDNEREDIERIKAEEMICREADRVIVSSKSDYEYVQTLYSCPPKKIILLPPGVNLSLFKKIDKKKAKKFTGAELNHKIILFVGRIVPLKGLDVLLYAIKILAGQNPGLSFCLWVAGAGRGEQKRLEKIKKLLNISSYVRFIGKKEREELPFYYNSAEVVIMPSSYESFGIAALEAMACGTPVIVSDSSGVADLFDKDDDHLLTSSSNPAKLAKKISNLLNNHNHHKSTSEDVLQKVKTMDWEKTAGLWLDASRLPDLVA